MTVLYYAFLILSAVCFVVMIIEVGLPTKADFSLHGAIRAFWTIVILVVVYWGLNNGGDGALATLVCGFVAGLWWANKAAEKEVARLKRTVKSLQYAVDHPPDPIVTAAVDMLMAQVEAGATIDELREATRQSVAAVAEIRMRSLEE